MYLTEYKEYIPYIEYEKKKEYYNLIMLGAEENRSNVSFSILRHKTSAYKKYLHISSGILQVCVFYELQLIYSLGNCC